MIRNFIKVSLRNLLRKKIYFFINVLGLVVSISSCLFILLYVQNELSYDRFFERADRIYKLALERKYPNHTTFYASVPHSFAPVIKHDFPEVEKVLLMVGPFDGGTLVTYRSKKDEVKSFQERNLMAADSTFFSFFSIGMLKGDPATSLSGPNKVVMNESTARRYFGEDDPLGKSITSDFGELKVTGIYKDLPDNSHLKFDMLISASTMGFLRTENYIRFFTHIYIELKPGADPMALEKKFPKMVDTYAAGQIETQYGQSWADYTKAGNGYRYFLQPLTAIHLDPTNIDDPIRPGGNIRYVYILISVAFVILIIACINFMNLAIARSSERALEVGIRKAVGSRKSLLVAQFLMESIFLALLSTGLAVLVVELFLPAFNNLAQKKLELIFDYLWVVRLLSFALLTGLLAGIYPAFVLSGYKPVEVLKSNFSGSARGSWLRNTLVVFQFSISIALIIGTLVIAEQLRFMQSKDLGFEKDKIIFIERAFSLGDKYKTFLNEVRTLPHVKAAGGSSHIIGLRGNFFGDQYQPEGSAEILTVKGMSIDDDFGQTMGFELTEGRFFLEETDDSLSLILNEAATRALGIKNPVGSHLRRTDQAFNGGPSSTRTFTIVGVLKDFHFQPLRDEITPVIFRSADFFRRGGSPYVAVRFDGSITESIQSIESKWKKFLPDQTFRFSFLDESIAHQYLEEGRSGKLFAIFSGIAIIIACVGLFALSAYSSSLRTKEIGIRKVMGASVKAIVILLSMDLTKLVLLSFVIATPLSWWLMSQWLLGFAYRVSLGAGTFVLAGVSAFGVSWLTVSYQSIKSAMANPVKSLRSE